MTGPEHYREAETLLLNVFKTGKHDAALLDIWVKAAQVHATLALAAATAYPAVKDYSGDEDGSVSRGWNSVA